MEYGAEGMHGYENLQRSYWGNWSCSYEQTTDDDILKYMMLEINTNFRRKDSSDQNVSVIAKARDIEGPFLLTDAMSDLFM